MTYWRKEAAVVDTLSATGGQACLEHQPYAIWQVKATRLWTDW